MAVGKAALDKLTHAAGSDVDSIMSGVQRRKSSTNGQSSHEQGRTGPKRKPAADLTPSRPAKNARVQTGAPNPYQSTNRTGYRVHRASHSAGASSSSHPRSRVAGPSQGRLSHALDHGDEAMDTRFTDIE